MVQGLHCGAALWDSYWYGLSALGYIEAFAFLHVYPLSIALLYLSVSALFALLRSE